MADFPTTYPSFTDLDGNQTLAANNHAARHNKVHREVEAIAQRVGKTGDTDPTTHEKKIADLQSDLSATDSNVATNTADIATNAADIATNAADIATEASTRSAADIAIAAALADLSGANDGAVTTRKFQPTIIDSNFTPAASRYSNSAATTQLVPNCSFVYTAGPTNETLVLWTGFMANKATSGNAEIWLYVNGSPYGINAYLDFGSPWYRGEFMNLVNVAANSSTTLAVYAQNASATALSITNEQARWMPTIRGFSVYRP